MSNARAGPAGAGAGSSITPQERVQDLPPELAPDAANNLLANLARADGNHDFTDLGPKLDEPINSAFQSSVVGTSVNDWNEDKALNAVFNGKEMKPFLREATKISTPEDVTTVTNMTYKLRTIPFEKIKKGGLQGAALVDALFGKKSADSRVILQVDFNHHGFLTYLAGAPGDNLTPKKEIGYMWSAATVNDPASKTDPTISIFTRGNHEVHLKPYYQKTGITIFPGNVSYDKSVPTNNFNTQYEVELSELVTKTIIGRKRKDSVTIKFTQGKNVATVSDSKAQNSIESLKPFVAKLLNKLGTADPTTKPKLHFELGTKWMQKRSGDWLQVLHAAMAHTLDLLDSPNDMSGSSISPETTPFFVTHDRVALAYALAMGVSSIYFFNNSDDKEDYIAVFDGRNLTEAQRIKNENERNAYCTGELTTNFTNINSVWEWYRTLLVARDSALDQEHRKVTSAIRELAGFITLPTADRTRPALETILKRIFESAMLHTSIEQLIPGNLENPGDLEAAPCLAYETAKTLTELLKQHGNNLNNTQIPGQILRGTQLQKSKVYKTLTNWSIIASRANYSATPNEHRFGAVGTSEYRDAFAFLAYIANSRNVDMKNEIAVACSNFHSEILPSDEETKIALLESIGARTHNSRQHTEAGLREILTQAYVYLRSDLVNDPEERAGATAAIRKAQVPAGPLVEVPEDRREDEDWPLLRLFTRVKLFFVRFNLFSEKKPEPDEFEAPTAGVGVQTGGWGERTQIAQIEDLDTRQYTDPPLHAILEGRVNDFVEGMGARRLGVYGEGEEEPVEPPRRVVPALAAAESNPADVSMSGPSSSRGSVATSRRASGADEIPALNLSLVPGDTNVSTSGNDPDQSGTNTSGAGSPMSQSSQGGGGRGDYLTSKGWTRQREGVWRDPLTFLDYTEDVATGFQRTRDGQKGGAISKRALTDEQTDAILDVLEPLLVMAADQIQTDADEMNDEDVTKGQLEYYTRGVDLLTAIQGEVPSVELALATYNLLCCSRFMSTTMFQTALGIADPYEAETMMLFFTGLETYSLKEAPAFVGSYIGMLKNLYITVNSNPIKTAKEIRDAASAIIARILKKYTSDSSTEPAAPEVRPTQSAGKRRPLFTTP